MKHYLEKLTKAEMLHILVDVIGSARVMNHFKESWDIQDGVQETNGERPCLECSEIARKLNVV